MNKPERVCEATSFFSLLYYMVSEETGKWCNTKITPAASFELLFAAKFGVLWTGMPIQSEQVGPLCWSQLYIGWLTVVLTELAKCGSQ